ncbi:hypothetical protein DB313_05435 (plasmid) [Borrelia turcica IST7]|uniref:Uncharacterized protein n=1 Tax=Borrelia turcica IST7 TaxID=1104446 RepID=A0A386PNW0_9SPIR|nr:hypothetical protein [Borrelia turcica]AYE36942.1 hypothetical protein DB313_05435 [Borrelia turcica IST7]
MSRKAEKMEESRKRKDTLKDEIKRIGEESIDFFSVMKKEIDELKRSHIPADEGNKTNENDKEKKVKKTK